MIQIPPDMHCEESGVCFYFVSIDKSTNTLQQLQSSQTEGRHLAIFNQSRFLNNYPCQVFHLQIFLIISFNSSVVTLFCIQTRFISPPFINRHLSYFEGFFLLLQRIHPGWCGSVDWALACKPNGRWFDSQSGHMPGLHARSPVDSVREATTHWCFSPFSLPSPI